ncbi:uncharacterized protein EAF01_009637 [Botrytis porri]|uniref:Centromere protein Cenp-K n=1 Tax=Botrytis porri TaxID=87229 RepID=A0A4Z1K3G5_9HELO|nr:uncharacterized protein EAF01_009637 [Botrytis porri]KAF7895675.1 hypothetical protein EAF01_009637 [Botrytis porri]TGO80064.1 hypothetical protein BPOR_1828g00010 [Botrytis porri]
MDIDQDARISAAYTTRLDQTLQDLQDRVKQQEAALAKLRANTSIPISSGPSPDPKIHLHQLRALKKAYDTLSASTPWLPPPKSALPALLAHRTTTYCIQETQECITTSSHDLTSTTTLLQKEKSDHQDALSIQCTLQSRISTLTTQLTQRTQKSPSQIFSELQSSFQTGKTHYDTETGNLIRAFNAFIDTHLASMLAAEELGGPIVGEMLSITPQTLIAGFSTQGKPKKPKEKPNMDKRQRRIDEIWGPKPSLDQDDDEEEEEEEWDETRAAAAEMRELAEELLNGLLEADENGSGGYVTLERDSAAARFLVRSKVAQYHFKDARKLKLVDFEKDIV